MNADWLVVADADGLRAPAIAGPNPPPNQITTLIAVVGVTCGIAIAVPIRVAIASINPSKP